MPNGIVQEVVSYRLQKWLGIKNSHSLAGGPSTGQSKRHLKLGTIIHKVNFSQSDSRVVNYNHRVFIRFFTNSDFSRDSLTPDP